MADDEIARWRAAFELIGGVACWREDPSRGAAWNGAWAGKPHGARVRIDGRKLSAARVAEALATGRIPPENIGRPSSLDWDIPGLPDHVPVGKGPLISALDEACAETGLSRRELAVLSKDRDPFLLDNARGHAEGHWFATSFRSLIAEGRRIHLRGVHYVFSSDGGLLKPRRAVYVNTDDDWTWLIDRSAKCARWLAYVPFDRIDDSRNEAPRYRRIAAARPYWSAGSGVGGVDELPSFSRPRVWLYDFNPHQKYSFAIFGEKSSLTPALDPLAQQYGADLYIGAGELSDTHAHDIAARAAEDARILVVFTVCDFDPSGRQMTTSISRKLRAFKTLLFPHLEYRVREIGLTLEQAIDHDLPSTPLKATERRAADWVERFGREQTEIDALLALAPGALEAEVRYAFAPYFDVTLARRAAAIRTEWEAEAQAELDARVGEERVQRWRARFQAAVAEIEAVNAEQDEAARGLDLDAPELPEADPGDEPDEGDIASSAMSLGEESLALKARKAFEDGDRDVDGLPDDDGANG